MKRKRKIIVIAVLAAAVIGLCIFFSLRRTGEGTAYGGIIEEFYESAYLEYLEENGYAEVMSQESVTVDLSSFKTADGMEAGLDDNGGVATSESGSITWEFEVKDPGFYNISVTYCPLPGTGSGIERILYLDGEIPYSGMKQIVFERRFTDESPEIAVKGGNEIRPRSIELYEQQTVYVEDSQRRGLAPYKLYLSKGKHSLTLESVKEPMELFDITFESQKGLLSYEETIGALLEKYPVYEGEAVYCQAERVMDATTQIVRSASSITIKNNVSDPELTPYHPYEIVYNTIGGDNWKYSGESIEWQIEVPREGLYHLSFKGRQSSNRGVTSYRRLRINGEVPFAEAQALPFTYSTKMQNYVLGEGTENGPYLFYFKEGVNTVSMEVVLGAFGETYSQISESVTILNDMYRKIVQITGTVPDQYIDYEIVKKLPEFLDVVESEADRLSSVLEDLVKITGEKGENESLVEKMVVQLENLKEDPEKIALSGELSTLKSNITSMATWLIQIAEMPLELDSFALYSDEETLLPETAGFFKGLYYNTIRFFATFFVDDTEVAAEDSLEGDADGRMVRVWLPTGRDQAQVLRNLIDEQFTPEYGIGIDLELVPIDALLPSTLAGVGPDVVLSVDQTKMMDFAIRNALVDLSSLEGFEQLTEIYADSALESVVWQDKIYGLPETQTFYMMFYRTDIFDALGLEPPATWEELKEIIPILQMNNYDVYIPGKEMLASMLVQNGGDLYLGEGTTYGVASGLSETVAMDTFKELTDFFTAYKLPVSMDFANRFRTGEVPLGIAEYTQYNTFQLLAPEIKGLWSFAPVPGVLQSDGTVDNTVTCTTVQSVMLKRAQERGVEEDAWTFLKWWMSTQTQLDYANAIEASLGSSARYAAANKEVLMRLPWASSDLNKIMEQLEQTRGIPPVPGHYMTTRMIQYTFDDVVTSNLNPRETLYLNIKDINQELTKKRQEFLGEEAD